MMTLRSYRNGFGRDAPERPRTRRAAFLLIALTGLMAEGCASLNIGNPCGGGGGCGLFRGCGLRLRNPFRRDVVVTDPCGEPALGVPIEGAPAVVAPGAVITAPPAEEIPQLEPAPAGESAAPTSGRTSSTQKTLYETLKPTGGTTSSRRAGSSVPAARLDDPLVDLPPLSAVAPAEDVTPPVAPAAETIAPTSPVAAAELPPRPATARPLSLAEGIARFKVVEPQLAGGSLPAPAGWTFLAEKGYRTVLDLRPREMAQPGDDAAALHAGLRYVVLPVTPEEIGETLLKRFDDEIAQAGNRPLYYFDADGSRAAVLWYLHLISTGQVDAAEAAKVAEELGPRDPKLWLAAATYLDAHKKPATAPAPTEPTTSPAATPTPTAPQPEPAATLLPPVVEPVATRNAQRTSTAADDPTTWKPYAALIVTGLSVPLARFGRSAIGTVSQRLASLPGPAHRPRSLPAASDE
jgi:protein tyrosine phosphatase (PTP) superfamily phosphohydrolase (DUF442 family)